MVYHIKRFGYNTTCHYIHHILLHSCYNLIYVKVMVLIRKGDILQSKGRYFKFLMHMVYDITHELNVHAIDHLTTIP
jgi:hypothetical protein